MARKLPDSPGLYHWSEWDRVVEVYMYRGKLHTRVYPHWQPVPITPRIAGTFTRIEK